MNLCESRIAVCLRRLTLNIGAQVARSTTPAKEKSIHHPCKGERFKAPPPLQRGSQSKSTSPAKEKSYPPPLQRSDGDWHNRKEVQTPQNKIKLLFVDLSFLAFWARQGQVKTAQFKRKPFQKGDVWHRQRIQILVGWRHLHALTRKRHCLKWMSLMMSVTVFMRMTNCAGDW